MEMQAKETLCWETGLDIMTFLNLARFFKKSLPKPFIFMKFQNICYRVCIFEKMHGAVKMTKLI